MKNQTFFSKLACAVTLLSVVLSLSGFSYTTSEAVPELEGTWAVDLRPSPDSPPYIQDMVITSAKNKQIKGTFYGTKIMNGKINTSWGKVVFAFTTKDGSGVYHTTGELVDGKLIGTTHSLGRDFLTPWTAARK